MPDREYVFIDLETTGLDPLRDEIIEIGAVKVRQGEILDSFHTMVKPTREISGRIKRLTGITEDLLKDAAPVNTVSPRLLDFIGDLPVVGHNIGFDLAFLNNKFYHSYREKIDTVELSKILLPCATSYRLVSLAEKLSAGADTFHRALADATTTAAVFFKLLEQFTRMDMTVLRGINRMLAKSDLSVRDFLLRIEEHKTMSFPQGKIEAAYKFFNKSPRHQSLSQLNVPVKNGTMLDTDSLKNLMGSEGPFARQYPDYQYRSQQVEIISLTARAFNEEKHLLIEAGTGTGKSLAYLLPAIHWAVQNNSRVVIATHTINLQEQLWQSDLPVIKQITGLEFREALVKGRSNYICLRKWEQKNKDPDNINPAEKMFFARLQVWLTETSDGDRIEINLNAQESAVWPEVCADPETCLGPKCTWFAEYCFFMNSRRRADAAHILITNHSVLLSDLKADNRVLPAHDYVIIDEAHNLEEQAGEQLGVTLSSGYINRTLQNLSSTGGSNQNPGFLYNLKTFLDNHTAVSDKEFFKEVIEKNITFIKDTRTGLRDFSECLFSFVQANTVMQDDYNYQTLRIRSEQQTGTVWDALNVSLENLTGRMRTTTAALDSLRGKIADLFVTEEDSRANSYIKELEYYIKVFREMTRDITGIFLPIDTDTVNWIEYDRTGLQYTLKAVPVSVGDILAEKLFSTKKGVILTSATLSVNGSFNHFKERAGLNLVPSESILDIQVNSPFNYDTQSLLGIIRDLPDPGKTPDELYAAEIVPVLAEIAKIFGGRTLVLFTSHRLLKLVYAGLEERLQTEEISVLGHNIDGGRTRLLEEFGNSPGSVLLGANSFWEGVDLPGDKLKCVVIVKLPFSPPGQPLIEARMEKLAAENKDGFNSLMLPQAVIKMKQGFGRLVRSERDEGVVVVLDRRIAEKGYGRKFLNSLPVISHIKGDRYLVLKKISDWMQGSRPREHQLKLIKSAACIVEQLKEKKEPL